MKIFDATFSRLERSLDVRLVRHNVLAANIANIDTAGYKPKDVDFKAAMANAGNGSTETVALSATAAGHMGTAGGAGGDLTAAEVPVTDGNAGYASIDGNRVDLDRTMASLAENSLQYGASARAITKKLGILRYVTSDGNG